MKFNSMLSPAPGSTALSPATPQGGFSLIEVLVTVLILAFGLLGVAGLLVKGVSNSSSSEATAKASQLAGELADRMRANPRNAVQAGSNYLLNSGTSVATRPDLWTDSAPTNTAAAANVARKDIRDWMAALASQLPSGRGRVTVVDTDRRAVIEVAWSNCIGTLSAAEQTACENSSSTAFRKIVFEVRL